MLANTLPHVKRLGALQRIVAIAASPVVAPRLVTVPQDAASATGSPSERHTPKHPSATGASAAYEGAARVVRLRCRYCAGAHALAACPHLGGRPAGAHTDVVERLFCLRCGEQGHLVDRCPSAAFARVAGEATCLVCDTPNATHTAKGCPLRKPVPPNFDEHGVARYSPRKEHKKEESTPSTATVVVTSAAAPSGRRHHHSTSATAHLGQAATPGAATPTTTPTRNRWTQAIARVNEEANQKNPHADRGRASAHSRGSTPPPHRGGAGRGGRRGGGGGGEQLHHQQQQQPRPSSADRRPPRSTAAAALQQQQHGGQRRSAFGATRDADGAGGRDRLFTDLGRDDDSGGGAGW